MSEETHPGFGYMCLQAAHASDWSNPGWKVPVTTRHALSAELSALQWDVACSEDDNVALENVQLTSLEDCKSLGTLNALDFPSIQALATPSSFGKGVNNVYDESVRKGTEVPASKLGLALDLPGAQDALNEVARTIAKKLFPGQPVKLVLYKLAIYEPKGHFKRHRDTTHGNGHHGTLLIGCSALGRSYEGGEFNLDIDRARVVYKLVPKTWVAFYTDIEHWVERVQKGVRLTLQFDIFLEDESHARPHTVACVPAHVPVNSSNLALAAAPPAQSIKVGDTVLGKRSLGNMDRDSDDDEDAKKQKMEKEGEDEEREEEDDDDDDDKDEDSENDFEYCGPPGLLVDPNGARKSKSPAALLEVFAPKLIQLLSDSAANNARDKKVNDKDLNGNDKGNGEDDKGDDKNSDEDRGIGKEENDNDNDNDDNDNDNDDNDDNDDDEYEYDDEDQFTMPKHPRTLGFLLRHQYRQQSLVPEYLKGLDRALYNALKASNPTLRIWLYPVYLEVNHSPMDSDDVDMVWSQTITIARPDARECKRALPKPVGFLRRSPVAAGLLEHHDGAEYVGNESLPEIHKYFAGAMFISLAPPPTSS